MPGDRPTAVLDANVLYPFMVRDVLLSLAEAGLFRPVWTHRINEEWSRHLIERRPERKASILATIETMNEAFPEALLEGHEDLVETIHLPDRDNRHVLAAAVQANASVIVTENIADFPPAVLAEHDIEARIADAFIAGLVERHLPEALSALRRMRERYDSPPFGPDDLMMGLIKCKLETTVTVLTPCKAAL